MKIAGIKFFSDLITDRIEEEEGVVWCGNNWNAISFKRNASMINDDDNLLLQ